MIDCEKSVKCRMAAMTSTFKDDDVSFNVVFERSAPVTDADISALDARWRAAPRNDAAKRAVERFF